MAAAGLEADGEIPRILDITRSIHGQFDLDHHIEFRINASRRWCAIDCET